MLPDYRLVVALILDDAGQAVLLDMLGGDALLHVILKIADGADICTGALACTQTHSALCAGKFFRLLLLCHGVDGLTADWTLGFFALGLVKDYRITAVGAGAAGQLIGVDIDGVPAGAVNLFSGKEAGFATCA